jgi:predicted RNA binding protein YcfA (HicA-like mRNA interferase family)
MAVLPVVSGRQALRAFEKLGWEFKRQHGSHMILTRPGSMVSLSVPDHSELRAGTLRSLIRSAGITIQVFVDALS